MRYQILNPPKRPDSFFTNNHKFEQNDGSCEFSFDSEKWKNEYGIESQLKSFELNPDNKWHCKHPKWEDNETCIFHTPVENKSPRDLCNHLEKFLSTKSGRNENQLKIIGGKFDFVDLRKISSIQPENTTIDLRHSIVYSDIYFEDASLPKIDLSGSVIQGDISINNSDIHGDFDLENGSISNSDAKIFINESNITGNVNLYKCNVATEVIIKETTCSGKLDFRNAAFHNGVDLLQSEFHAGVEFFDSNIIGTISSENETSLRLYDCVFSEVAHFQGIYLERNLNGERSEFEDGLVLMHIWPADRINLRETYSDSILNLEGMHVSESDVMLQGSEINGQIELSSTKFVNDDENALNIHLEASYIDSGNIYQSEGGYVNCFLEQATVGEVNFKHKIERTLIHPFPMNIIRSNNLHSQDEPIFDRLSIYDTNFKRFDFGDYRTDLEQVGWSIHKSTNSDPNRQLRLSVEPIEGDGKSSEHTMQANLGSNEVLERTYLKAKHGAENVGDEIAASMFHIKEMQYRKRRYRENFVDEIQNRDIISGIYSGSRWLINSFLESLSSYGEKIWPVIMYSIVLIFQSALLLPVQSGFSGSEQNMSYSTVKNGYISLSELVTQSLYFSTVTFTTVGYGDYTPNKGIPQMVVAAESFLGALLIAILVFTLGKRVS